MTEVCRQAWQMGIHVDSSLVPVYQRLDREAVPKIMNPWAVAVSDSAESDAARQIEKRHSQS
jgi:hypothetical protein